MKEIANRWLPPLEEGEFSHNLLAEMGRGCSRLFRSAQRPSDQVGLFVLEAICSHACTWIDASPDRFPSGNAEYHENLKAILHQAIVDFLRAETEQVDDRYMAVERLLQAYRRAAEL